MKNLIAHFRYPDLGWQRFLMPGKLVWLRGLPWMLFFGVTLMVIYSLAGWPLDQMMATDGNLLGLAIVTAGTIAIAALYAGVVRLTEKRWPSELAPRAAVIDLPLGLLLGFVLMALTVGALFVTGQYNYRGFVGGTPWTLLALSIISGVCEEIIMRGILLRMMARLWNPTAGIVISSLVFGFMHAANPDATVWSSTAIALETGLLFGSLYMLSGRLWIPIGLHAGWNFAQGYLFGAEVSGYPLDETLIVTGPVAGTANWLSGGGFGPEASLPAFILCTGAGLVGCWLAWRYGRLRKQVNGAS